MRSRPNPIRTKVTRASPRTVISATAKQKHTNSFICILSIITSFPIIVSFFISSNFIRNKIRTKSKIKFSNKIISISLVTYKITFILNIIYCNIRDKQQDKYLNYFHLHYNFLVHNGHH